MPPRLKVRYVCIFSSIITLRLLPSRGRMVHGTGGRSGSMPGCAVAPYSASALERARGSRSRTSHSSSQWRLQERGGASDDRGNVAVINAERIEEHVAELMRKHLAQERALLPATGMMSVSGNRRAASIARSDLFLSTR